MKRVLIACYGGGHVQSLIPLAHRLRSRAGLDTTIIGFTTARAAFNKAGLPALGYDALLTASDRGWMSQVEPFLPSETHPDITARETRAYFALGFKDLVEYFGRNEAKARIVAHGRKAFLPVATFAAYLEKEEFDLVITSTSPRSELALQRAAVNLNIPGIAVSDLFLQHEAEYICRPDYAPDVTVISQYVAESLRARGLPSDHRTHVVGNPAFDSLADKRYQRSAKSTREELGIPQATKVVTWIGSTGNQSLVGKRFLAQAEVVAFLEMFCAKEKDYRYLIRPHPSATESTQVGPNGDVCPKIEIETCIHMSDIVMLETSTVGLQSALVGKPVVTIAADSYPPYAEFGLAVDVPDIESAADAIRSATPPELSLLGYPQVGSATDSVMTVIDSVLN